MVKLLIGTAVGISLWLQYRNLCISISNHSKLKKIMSKEDQIKASIQELDDASNAIAAKLQKAIDAEKDNVSPESLAALQSVADNLKALGADPENPIPVAEPAADAGTGDAGAGTGDAGAGAGAGTDQSAVAQ